MAQDQRTLVVAFTGAIVALTVLYLFWTRSRKPEPAPIIKPPNAATREVCAALASKFPDIVHGREDDELWTFLKTYWAAQAQAPKPALLVRPRNAAQVSEVVKVLREFIDRSSSDEQIQFGIRSGGHSPVQGFASADAGIVLDLGLLNSITLSADRTLVELGPGATWHMVYRRLETCGLAVAGGRAATVGVGGLVLGGGLSWYSPKVGFVCDAVVSFEVVLADGSIVTASDHSQHSDLAIALRGGGNNYGIVTKFTARTFPQTDVWMGYCFHYLNATERLLKSYYDFGKSEGYDKRAMCILIFSFTYWTPFIIPLTCLNYTEPSPHPPALRPFSREKKFWNSLGVRSPSSAVIVLQSMTPFHMQDFFHTTTFENDLEVMHEAYAAFKDLMPKIKKVSGMISSIAFQLLVPSATLHHASNAMGIDTDKTLVIMILALNWNNEKDNAIVYKAVEDLNDRVEAYARKRGVYHPYKYSNYCSASQNPYPGYGPERLKFLQDVSRTYDPAGIFQKNVPGGHKVLGTSV